MSKLTQEQKEEITKISQEFAKPFKDTVGGINGSGWLIVDPLAVYLHHCGFKNELSEMPQKEDRPQVLIIEFSSGDKFIPAGGDLSNLNEAFSNWMWL